jgi:hypothetical protein
MIHDEEGAMADEACLPTTTTTPYSSSAFLHLLHPTQLQTERRVDLWAGDLCSKRASSYHWTVGATHDTVIQHHHDQHRSLHHKAYLRNALKLITRSLSR